MCNAKFYIFYLEYNEYNAIRRLICSMQDPEIYNFCIYFAIYFSITFCILVIDKSFKKM